MPNNYSPTSQEAKLKKSIIEALKEVKLIRKGKFPKRTAREMLKEVKEELYPE